MDNDNLQKRGDNLEKIIRRKMKRSFSDVSIWKKGIGALGLFVGMTTIYELIEYKQQFPAVESLANIGEYLLLHVQELGYDITPKMFEDVTNSLLKIKADIGSDLKQTMINSTQDISDSLKNSMPVEKKINDILELSKEAIEYFKDFKSERLFKKICLLPATTISTCVPIVSRFAQSECEMIRREELRDSAKKLKSNINMILNGAHAELAMTFLENIQLKNLKGAENVMYMIDVFSEHIEAKYEPVYKKIAGIKNVQNYSSILKQFYDFKN